MSTTKHHQARFRAGEWVSFSFGAKKRLAQITELRGPLGIRGRNLYRVKLETGSDEPDFFELPEDELEPASQAIIDFLSRGGLVEILQSNTSGGEPPKVWLAARPGGGITHQFSGGLGVIAGGSAPFGALNEGRIFTPKRDEVMRFLEGLGLKPDEAAIVLSAVGTSP